MISQEPLRTGDNHAQFGNSWTFGLLLETDAPYCWFGESISSWPGKIKKLNSTELKFGYPIS